MINYKFQYYVDKRNLIVILLSIKHLFLGQCPLLLAFIKSLPMKKKALIKSWMHGWPSQCVITSQLFSVLRSRCGRSSSWRLDKFRPLSAVWEREARRREQQVGRRRERERRRPGAACGLDSCAAPLLPLSPRSPRSHIIYDSIRTRSKLAVLPTNNKLVFPLTRLDFFAKYNSFQDAVSIKPTAKTPETITPTEYTNHSHGYETSHSDLYFEV